MERNHWLFRNKHGEIVLPGGQHTDYVTVEMTRKEALELVASLAKWMYTDMDDEIVEFRLSGKLERDEDD